MKSIMQITGVVVHSVRIVLYKNIAYSRSINLQHAGGMYSLFTLRNVALH